MDFQYSFKYSKIYSIYLNSYKRTLNYLFAENSASIAAEGVKSPKIAIKNYKKWRQYENNAGSEPYCWFIG
jgi:hypothetical protein